MKQATPRGLKRLATSYGVQLEYEDSTHRRQVADPEVALVVLRALGAPVDTSESVAEAARHRDAERWQRVLDPVSVAWDGRAVITVRVPESESRGALRYEIYLESGDVLTGTVPPGHRKIVRRIEADGRIQVELQATIPERLPLGYHDLALETRRHRGHALLISAPRKAFMPRDAHGRCERTWGVFLPLHALHGSRDPGIGDFSALEELMTWSGDRGAQFVGTLPLLATFLDQPFDPSPYSPLSRLFWNEIHIDVARAVQESDSAEAARMLGESDAVAKDDLVDHRAIMQQKRRIIEVLARDFFAKGGRRTLGFRKFLAAHPLVEDYARFRAVVERQKSGWPAWPRRLQEGWIATSDYDPDGVRYHLFAQYLATRQLATLSDSARARGTRLYLDLPLGVHADSYDVWRERDLFATSISVGAPPDAFFTRGQNWGFPPMLPTALTEQRFQYFIDSIRSHLHFAGALRLDHVMGLHRLFWIPQGMEARQGVYVRYPAEQLYAILTLESVRHEAIIIGEDLGTVPPEVRQSMDRHGVSRMYVVQFEADPDNREPLSPIPTCSAASLNTHDMPTWAAFASGQDADLRHELDLIPESQVRQTHEERATLLARIAGQLAGAGVAAPDCTDTKAILAPLLKYMAQSDAMLLLVNLEDLWGETRPQNVPGTGPERPNWRRRSALTLEQIQSDEQVNCLLRMVDETRREESQ